MVHLGHDRDLDLAPCQQRLLAEGLVRLQELTEADIILDADARRGVARLDLVHHHEVPLVPLPALGVGLGEGEGGGGVVALLLPAVAYARACTYHTPP
eukprot:CAMPEP_0173393810 /NCGR_PEP_ID=MMETSP1356-20130122/22325_1 /TAXON_ID=77927 ORGANISM="Hemiselmis virescens, Strain PCC157" /NCGR_SAMPLE_ID=MMETSP1356 /ASSEMBLY_ACC=CAM_ASM_000847 /LENGTH=97 /DNA_ID=CAMNT_0014351885 /DNA_START=136 /DNA_END=426 /DNA_ORIENTATION=+